MQLFRFCWKLIFWAVRKYRLFAFALSYHEVSPLLRPVGMWYQLTSSSNSKQNHGNGMFPAALGKHNNRAKMIKFLNREKEWRLKGFVEEKKNTHKGLTFFAHAFYPSAKRTSSSFTTNTFKSTVVGFNNNNKNYQCKKQRYQKCLHLVPSENGKNESRKYHVLLLTSSPRQIILH